MTPMFLRTFFDFPLKQDSKCWFSYFYSYYKYIQCTALVIQPSNISVLRNHLNALGWHPKGPQGGGCWVVQWYIGAVTPRRPNLSLSVKLPHLHYIGAQSFEQLFWHLNLWNIHFEILAGSILWGKVYLKTSSQ